MAEAKYTVALEIAERAQALIAAARRLAEIEAAQAYLTDSGLLGRPLLQWAKEAGWTGLEGT